MIQNKKDWFDLALEYQSKENYSKALIAINKYIDLNPQNKNGKLLKAVIYGDLSNYNLVLKILKEIQPNSKEDRQYSKFYFSELGDTYKELGNHIEALKWYNKMIEVVPNETMGYIYKGCCLASVGKYDLAKIEHLKATKLEGDPEEAFYNLALISRAEMNFEKAKEYCEKSLAIDPDDKKVLHCYKDIIEAIELLKE